MTDLGFIGAGNAFRPWNRLPFATTVVRDHGMDAVVWSELRGDVDASHREDAIEVGQIDVVRIEMIVKRLRKNNSGCVGDEERSTAGVCEMMEKDLLNLI